MPRARWVSGLALATCTLTACGMNSDSGLAASSGDGHMIYAEQTAPAAAWAPESDDAHVLTRAGCLETMVRYGYDGELEPMLATEWNQVDPKTWRFTLRDGVSFQDGTAMDADAVAVALSHLLAVSTPARAFNSDVISAVNARTGRPLRSRRRSPIRWCRCG